MTSNARYILFLNPDTEIVDGTFGELVAAMDARPDVGLAGVRQVAADGTLWPTIRYFPSVRTRARRGAPVRALAAPPAWAGERELDLAVYAREVECDWTSGSFMFARREALLSAGLLDERFFIYSEEPDLCLRMLRAGWRTVHLPQHDDRAPRGQGRRAAADGRSGRLHPQAVRAQALQPGRSARPT